MRHPTSVHDNSYDICQRESGAGAVASPQRQSKFRNEVPATVPFPPAPVPCVFATINAAAFAPKALRRASPKLEGIDIDELKKIKQILRSLRSPRFQARRRDQHCDPPPIMRDRVTSLILALAVFVLSALEQSPAAQQAASRVALAAVTDLANRPFVDVGPDDFVIQEAGAAREVLSVRPADYPIIVLLDTGDDARGEFELMRKAAAHFIDRVGQRPVAIGTLGVKGSMVTTFDDEREVLTEKLAALKAQEGAPSLLLQAAGVAGERMKETGALFSAIVILSANPNDASPGTLEETVAPIVDSGAAVHVIANRPGPAAAGGSARPPIRALAQQTHGEFTTVYSAASYQAALDRLADRMNAEMMIEYLVPVGSKPVDVKVGIRVIGARVRGLGVAPK
jgi:hypothetical protein